MSKRYIRQPQHDRRIARGDDFAGDGWLDTQTGEVVHTVVGHDPNAARIALALALLESVERDRLRLASKADGEWYALSRDGTRAAIDELRAAGDDDAGELARDK